MGYDPEKHHRRSIRLRGWDYTYPGAYFVTICTHNGECLFEDPVLRRVVETMWRRIPHHFPYVQLDEFVVMPNHVHGIIWIVGARHSLAFVPLIVLIHQTGLCWLVMMVLFRNASPLQSK